VHADRRLSSGELERFLVRRSREMPGVVLVTGVVDETADLSFFETLSGPTKLNLRGVRRVNSYGVRAWIDGIRRVPPDVHLELIECSPAVVDQANMVAGFLGRAQITSFYAPMVCSACGYEKDELFKTEEYRQAGHLPDVGCPRCGAAMEMNDLEEHYLLFAKE
jgi:hypothetical protein